MLNCPLFLFSAPDIDSESISARGPTPPLTPILDFKAKAYFDITFDNVNQKIGVRHHVRGKKNTMLNMVQSYATLERIGSLGLSNVTPCPEEIATIPIENLLPTIDDEKLLKQELSTMVSRILTRYIPAFSDLDTVWSIPHKYSSFSGLKSEVVSKLIVTLPTAIHHFLFESHIKSQF